tara:strand:- start:1417 stop:1881 length:465 start_codon:yes stop_codon:yes gene_type:complete
MFFKIKNHINIILIFTFIILINCQLQEPSKNHGIVFLENRSNKLSIDKSNKNDVIKIIGHPHTKSISNENEWIYFERVITKGEFHKLGQNVLKSNNVLILNFDKYGILKNKRLLNKDSKNELAFSKEETENELTKKSFVESFLSSIRTKMYGNK